MFYLFCVSEAKFRHLENKGFLWETLVIYSDVNMRELWKPCSEVSSIPHSVHLLHMESNDLLHEELMAINNGLLARPYFSITEMNQGQNQW